MKSALLFALGGSLVAAQLDGIPQCARECVSKSISGSNVAGCKVADIACVCRNKDYLENMACCLVGVCNQEDQEKTVKFATQLCNASNVQVPSKVECKKAATGAGSNSSGGSSMASMTPTSSGTSSSSASPTSGADDTDSTDTASSTSGRATSAGTNSASSTSSAGPSPTPTGGAANVVGGMSGVAGAVMAVLAIL